MNKLISKEFQTKLANYIISFFFTTALLIYIINLPNLLTKHNPLVKEYYYDNFLSSLLLDVFLFGFYILIGVGIIKLLKVKNRITKYLVMFITIAGISGLFMIYYLNTKRTKSFFSRWFHSVKYTALIYDVLIVGFTYIIYDYLNSILL